MRRSIEWLDDVEILSSKKDASGRDMFVPVDQVVSFSAQYQFRTDPPHGSGARSPRDAQTRPVGRLAP